MENNNQVQEDSFWEKYKLVIIGGIIFLLIITAVSLFLTKKPSQLEVIIEPQGKTENNTALKILPGQLYLEADKTELAVKDEFEVRILMETNGYNISAAAGVVEYDRDLLEVVEINTKNSVLSMSAEKKNQDGLVSIVRGSPGDRNWQDSDDGYSGSDGILGSVVFKALKTGQAEINFVQDKSRLILDDGYGTSMEMSYENLKIRIN